MFVILADRRNLGEARHEVNRKGAVTGFSLPDYGALGFFVVAWAGYHLAIESTAAGRRSLNRLMTPTAVSGRSGCSCARTASSTPPSWRPCRTERRSSPRPRFFA